MSSKIVEALEIGADAVRAELAHAKEAYKGYEYRYAHLESEVALIESALAEARAAPTVSAEPVVWEYRWLNPGDQQDIPKSMLEWKRILPARLQSIEDAVLGFKAASYHDKPCYEVRALGVIAPPPVEASQPAAHEPEWTLWQFQRADGAWSQFMDERHYENTRDSDGWNMRRIVRVVESSQQQCPCGDRETSQCPGEWEPGCDLGANEAHARRVDEASQQQASGETTRPLSDLIQLAAEIIRTSEPDHEDYAWPATVPRYVIRDVLRSERAADQKRKDWGYKLRLVYDRLTAELSAAKAVLSDMKVRMCFMGHPGEPMVNNGTEDAPHWVPDWRFQAQSIEAVLHGTEVTADPLPKDTQRRDEVEVAAKAEAEAMRKAVLGLMRGAHYSGDGSWGRICCPREEQMSDALRALGLDPSQPFELPLRHDEAQQGGEVPDAR